jgi:hypothetical protein
MHDQTDPVFITVEAEEGTLRPLMTYGPKHGNPIHLVECIVCINTEETKIIVTAVGFPELIGGMDCTLNTRR